MKHWISFLTLLATAVFLTLNLSQAQTINEVPSSDIQVKLSYAPIVKSAAPAVVNIYTKRVVKTRRSVFMDDPFFRRFFGGGSSVPRQRIERSLGSGVIVKSEGIIVTNHHVIEGADEITVALSDRREFDAEVILKDESTDLAILRINTEGEKLPILELSNSADVEVGDLVLAIGNPFGVGQSVTSGIVSALARTQVGDGDYQFFIQTDAAVNPGNSGGALIGMDGKLLGINSSIFSRSGGSDGIGFAIPANMVDYVVTAAMNDGQIIRPWFGAAGQAVSADIAESLGFDRPGGILIDNLYPGSPAERGGLKQGDVVLSAGGEEVFDTQGLRYHIGLMKPDDEMVLDVLRGDQKKRVIIEFEVAPEVPPRNITTLEGDHIFKNVRVANLSPAYSEELGINMFERGVVILELDRSSPVRRLNVLRAGDVFETIDDQKIDEVSSLLDILEDGDDRVDFTVRRSGRLIECSLGERGYYCQ